MSISRIPEDLREYVKARANGHCEYCKDGTEDRLVSFHVDHIIAEKHHGKTEESNLALACASCDSHKGSNISSIDQETGEKTELFNPRTDNWSDHFKVKGNKIEGLTPKGRATADVLEFNSPKRMSAREEIQPSEGIGQDDALGEKGNSYGEDYDYSYDYGF